MVHQCLTDLVARATDQGEDALVQSGLGDGLLNDPALDLGGTGVRVVGLYDDGAAGRQCRGDVATRHRVGDREVAGAEDDHRAEGDLLQPVVEARCGLPVRLSGVDGRLEEAALADDDGELAEDGGGPYGLALELGGRQTGLQLETCGELVLDRLQLVRDEFEERGAFRKPGVAVAVERFVGQAERAVDLGRAAEGELGLDEFAGGGVERLHGSRGRGHLGGSDQQVSGEGHACAPLNAAVSSSVVVMAWA